jgi:hypothetical protein
MAKHATEAVDVEQLYVSATDAKPVNIDWEALGSPGESWSFAEAVDVWVHDRWHNVIVEDRTIAALVVDGRAFRGYEYEEYIYAHQEDGDYDALIASLPEGESTTVLSEYEFDSIFDVDPSTDGPMMSYWYPFDMNPHDLMSAALLLTNLPLAAVEVHGQKGLALTGGGEDLTWEICEAFIRLGWLPPAHFAMLPGVSGRGESARDKVIIAACKRTFATRVRSAQFDLDCLNERWK